MSELPSDIEIYEIPTLTPTRIATQPEDATFNTGEPARAVVRSAPAWSPDGTQLVWTEDAAPEDVRRLIVYDVASGQAQILTQDLPLQAGFQQTLPLRWGAGGIALHSLTASEADPQATVDTFIIFNSNGTPLSSAAPQAAEGEYIYDFQWIDDRGTAKVGIIYSTGRWDVIDPATGTIAPLQGEPELYSLTAPDGLSIVFGVSHLPNVGPVFTWRTGDTLLPYSGPIEWLGIAPAGDAIAYASRGEAFIWRNGQPEPVPGTGDFGLSVAEIVWGPVGWRVAG